MFLPERLKTTISGSFKFKTEIDQVIDQFASLRVKVLAPPKGRIWIYRSGLVSLPSNKNFHPLPQEERFDIKAIEDSFLSAISRSDFLYVVSKEGYLGTSVSMELGYALACRIPIFCSEPISKLLDDHPWWDIFVSEVPVCTPDEAVERTKDHLLAVKLIPRPGLLA